MAASKDDNIVSTADREIVTTRIFNAPRELVFAAFTDPRHISNWWGPKGFTTTTHEMNLKPGGVWIFIMHGPDGTDYHNKIVYREVVKPERLVYSHGGTGDHEHIQFETTVTFEDLDGKTKLTMRALFKTAAARDFVVKEHGAIEGAIQTLERLGEHIDKTAISSTTNASSRDFVLSHEFSEPRELVWKAWSEREGLMQWVGPKGFTIPVARLDFRPGGIFHYCFRSADGHEMWGRFVYREIVKPERIVWINSFSDPNGGLTHPPFSEAWPAEMLSTATFTEHQGKTTVTLRWSAYNATEEEQKTFDTSHDSMKEGWTGTFEKLEAYLANAQARK